MPTRTKGTYWKSVSTPPGFGWGSNTLYSIGINADNTLYNPRNYPEDLVRAAVAAAQERQRVRRSEAAKRAAVTRADRKQRKVYEVVDLLKAGGQLTPGTSCEICGKGLGDPESKARGIGSDCWQFILSILKAA